MVFIRLQKKVGLLEMKVNGTKDRKVCSNKNNQRRKDTKRPSGLGGRAIAMVNE